MEYMQSSDNQTRENPRLMQQHASLLSWLQSQDKEYYANLLTARPDVIYTLPHSTADLATRLLTQHSIHLALLHRNWAEIFFLLNLLEPNDQVDSITEIQLPTFISNLTTVALIWPKQETHPDSQNLSPTSEIQSIWDGVYITPLLQRLSYYSELLSLNARSAPITESKEKPDAISSIANLVYACERILETLDNQSLKLTQKNTIALQAWKKFSKTLGYSLQETGWLIEILYSLDLLYIEYDPLQAEQRYLILNPEQISQWNNNELIIKWYHIARTAISLPRGIWKINNHTNAHEETIPPLHPQLYDRDILLSQVVEAFISLPPENRFSEPIAGIIWYRPYILAGIPISTLTTICNFLEFLGIISRNQFTNFGVSLVQLPSDEIPHKLASLAPTPVDKVIVQSNGSIIVSGIPSARLYQTLLSFSELESGGMGAHFRISTQRIIRSLKNHLSLESLLQSLTRISETPIPDTIISNFHDCARSINRIIIGSAKSYIHCNDEMHLTTLLLHPDLQVHLKQITPNIAISDLPPDLLSQIFQLHSFDAFIQDTKLFAFSQSSTPVKERELEDSTALHSPLAAKGTSPSKLHDKVQAAMTSIEAGDKVLSAKVIAGTTIRFDGSKSALAEGMHLLRESIALNRTVKVEYISIQGKRQSRIFIPLGLYQGRISYRDDHSAQLQEIAIHRIIQIEQVAIEMDSSTA